MDVVLISFAAVAIPFILGFGFGVLAGYSYLIAFVIGASLSLTSEATKAIALIERKVLKTKLGEIMLVAGTLDNIFELLFLSLLLVFVSADTTSGLIMLPIEIIAFVLFIFAAIKLIPRFFNKINLESDDDYFTLTILIGISMALVSTALEIGPIVGALIAGLILQKSLHHEKAEKKVEKNMKLLTFGLIIPFFYLQIGLNIDLAGFFKYPEMILIIFILGLIGKMAGSLIVKPFTKLKFNQLTLIGWGMNSRGVIELVIIEIARQKIPNFPMEIYTAIVFMSILTTLIFPFALDYYLKKYPGIMVS